VCLLCCLVCVCSAVWCVAAVWLQRNGPSIFMCWFMSLVFTMRERVESSMEVVSGYPHATHGSKA
jgi:hypothetical protein